MYKTFLINNNIKKDISNLNTDEINKLTSTLSKSLKRKMLKILFYNKNIKNEYIESTKDTKLLKVNDKFNTLAFAICITKESVIIKDYDYVEVCLVNNKEPDNNDLNTLLAYSIK